MPGMLSNATVLPRPGAGSKGGGAAPPMGGYPGGGGGAARGFGAAVGPSPAGGTPTTVPARPWASLNPPMGGAAAIGGGGAAAMGGGGGAGNGANGANGDAGAVGGCWLISMVPLNFGAAAPFKLKPHFVQVVACSVFCVPQFGQNTRNSSHEPA